MAEQTVALEPGESEVVAFETTPTVAKTYQVLVDGLTGSFKAVAPPAEFMISDLSVSPSSVTVKKPVTISFRITNVGGQSGNYYVCEKAYVNGEFIVGIPGYECSEWFEGTLAPGKSKSISHAVYPQTAGTYTIYVNGHVVSFEAEAPPPFDPWVYDFNGDGYIDDTERTKAAADYFAGIITKQQMLQVANLPSPPPPPPPPCATKAEKNKAAADYFAGIITKEEALAIMNLPTCPE